MVPEMMVDRIIIKLMGSISTRKDINQHFQGMGAIAYLADLTM